MALTTLQFWQQQFVIEQAAHGAAQSGLAVAQAAQKKSAAALAESLKALDAAGAKMAAQRAQLAVTSVPAEAGALITQITQGVIAQRKLQGTMLDRQADLAEAGADADAAAAVLARCALRVAAAQAAIAAAGADGKQRDMLKTAIAAPPLSTIAGDASDLLDSLAAAPVTNRLTGNFPAALQTIAKQRHASRSERLAGLNTALAAAQDALGAGAAADNGLGGAVKKTWLALQRAQGALADQVARAPARYAKARALLQKLEAINPPPGGTVPDVLTDAEKKARSALDAAGAAAVPAATAIDTELGKVFAAEDAVDTAILDQIAADVDQLPASASVAAKRAAAVAAQAAFNTALATFASADQKNLDQWEAVIPDPAWSVLLDYDDSVAALTTLKTLKLPDLAADLDKAEDAYTTALAAAEKAQRRADALADAVALREARLTAARTALGSRLASAIRGDTY